MCSCNSGSKSCCLDSHKSHQSSCCDASCGCGCQSQKCHSSCSSSCGSSCDDKAKKLLEIADMAWVELLKEKIKEHIKANDPKLDELAKIVSEANHHRWKHKMESVRCSSGASKCCDDYKKKLQELFCCADDHCNDSHCR